MSFAVGYPSIDKPWLKYYSREAIEAGIPQGSMYDFLYENNKSRPDAKALNFFGRKLTYRQLFAEIDKAAKAFQALGVQPGEVVTLVALSCVPSVACLYGLNRIGAVSNYVNVLASEEELTRYMKDGNSRIVVALDLFGTKVLPAAKAAGAEKVIFFSLGGFMPTLTRIGYSLKTAKMDKSFLKDPIAAAWTDFIKAGENTNLIPKACPEDICFYGHTGGTTGFPKTVLLQNKAFNAVAQNYLLCMDHNIGDPYLSSIVPFVTYGTMINIHMPLCMGLETVLLPKFDADEWPMYMKKYHIIHVCAIPAYVEPIMDKLADMDLSGLVTVGMGGDGMNVPLEKKLNAFLRERGSTGNVLKGYGMTEVCATATVEFPFANKTGSVGIPLIKNNFMIYDNDAQQELSYGQTGEVCMQCASVMAGYKDNPEETEKLFRTHPDGSRWIHTGDLGHIDEDGFLFIEGRMKRMIMTIYDGVVYKVFPEQIEAQLSKHPGVTGVCIVGDTDGNDRVLHAFVIPEKDAAADLEQSLKDYCTENMSLYTRPRFYTFCDSFPRTPAGKVDYRALEELTKKDG